MTINNKLIPSCVYIMAFVFVLQSLHCISAHGINSTMIHNNNTIGHGNHTIEDGNHTTGEHSNHTTGNGNHTMGHGNNTIGHGNHTIGHGNHTTGEHGNHTNGHSNHTTGNGNHTMGHGNNTMGHGNHTTGEHGNHTNGHSNHTTGEHGNHTMGHGNNTMGHGNHTTGEHGNHTNGHSNHTTGEHGNHTNGQCNHTDGHVTIDHGNHGITHGTGHGTYFMTSNHLTLFFKDWTSTESSDLSVMCVVIAIMAWFYEGMKLVRQYVTKMQLAARSITNKNSSKVEYSSGSDSTLWKLCLHLSQTFLHAVQIFLGYLLMLGFMTFNTYLCVSIMVGFTMGYLCFGWVLPAYIMQTEHDTCCS